MDLEVDSANQKPAGEKANAPGPRSSPEGTYALPEDALVILPVRGMVLFPGMIMPIALGREGSIAAAQLAAKAKRPIGVLLQRNPEVEQPGPDDLCLVGTVASILRYITTPDGTHHAICQGQQRFRVVEYLEGYPFLVARVGRIEEPEAAGNEIEARFVQLKERALQVLELLPQAPQELVAGIQGISSAGALTDLVAGVMDIEVSEKQSLLETLDLQKRMDTVLDKLAHRLQVLKLSREIDQRTKASMDETQRRYVLREQMKSIQKELGEGEDGHAGEIEELRKAIAEAGMPEEVEKQALKEVKRLERMSDATGEYSMVRTYLDWLIELPWKSSEPDTIDITEARRILDADHFGLEQVKKRILEYLAVRKLNPDGHGPILCFVGPPGVGKTSLGQSVAKALGRKFMRVSLGGVHDEAEIRGHRRTYIVARQLKENGLKPEQFEIADAALTAIIRDYTREAGVRSLERQIGAVCRRAAVRIAEGGVQKVRIEEGDLAEILGSPKFENEVALRAAMPGVATGLAWTPVGGDILFIEASRTPGAGKLILTGQLGDVMKESAQGALTLVKSRATALGIDPAAFEKMEIGRASCRERV